MEDLKNKVVLITGASSGVGAAVACAFGAHGARVAVHYRNGHTAAGTTVAHVKEAGGDAMAVQADVTLSEQVDEMVGQVDAYFGRIDVLVNNAGGFVRCAPIVEADEDVIDDVFRLNARSVVVVSRRVIPLMQRLSAAIPMGRLGKADECTGAFLFLASDMASSYITGQIVEVNGGQVMP
jgi:3-oxoacyl-[acyl-carrier protein] reductase